MTPQEKARSLRPYIVKAASSLDDTDAVKAKELYEVWVPNKHYAPKGYRVRDPEDMLLYKLIPDEHTSQADWPPRLVPAVWEHIPEEGQGTKNNPIPYNNNMRLELGKYYTQFDVEYLCTRDTVNPVYADLKDLVPHYVEVVTDA